MSGSVIVSSNTAANKGQRECKELAPKTNSQLSDYQKEMIKQNDQLAFSAMCSGECNLIFLENFQMLHGMDSMGQKSVQSIVMNYVLLY